MFHFKQLKEIYGHFNYLIDYKVNLTIGEFKITLVLIGKSNEHLYKNVMQSVENKCFVWYVCDNVQFLDMHIISIFTVCSE